MLTAYITKQENKLKHQEDVDKKGDQQELTWCLVSTTRFGLVCSMGEK